MRVIPWVDVGRSLLESRRVAATIGVFDGVHTGHQILLQEVMSSRQDSVPSMVVTFRENPKKLLGKPYLGDLMTWPEKHEILLHLGVDIVVLIDFSPSFSTMSGRDFFLHLKRSFLFSKLVLGWNFSFGKDSSSRTADIGWFADPETRLIVVPPFTLGDQVVSSSRIRQAVVEGDLLLARTLLGRPYTIPLEPPFQWTGGRCAVDRMAVGKLLPPLGHYAVHLDQTEALIRVEEDRLTWESPPGKRFRQIVFV